MGRICFQTSRIQFLDEQLLRSCYMTGLEGIAWERELIVSGNRLMIDRQTHESGHFFFPWRTENGLDFMLGTTSLRETKDEYHLEVELARGTLHRLRSYLAERSNQFELSRTYTEKLTEAHERLIEAVFSWRTDFQQAGRSAANAIELCLDVINGLLVEDAGHLMEARHQAGMSNSMFGVKLGRLPDDQEDREVLAQTFDSVMLPFNWKDLSPDEGKFQFFDVDQMLQWSHRHGKKVFAGPLIELTDAGLPQWIYLWQNDFAKVQNYVIQYVQEVVRRYKGRVHAWHASCGLNSASVLGFSEEQTVRLAVDVVETIRHLDNSTPVIVSFDFPWGDYAANRRSDLSPLQFADALVRAELGINGIGIDLSFGAAANECTPRDFLELSRMLRQWSSLQLPLVVGVSLPTAFEQEEGELPAEGFWDITSALNLLRVLRSKPSVQALFWNQLTDGTAQRSGGVLALDRRPKEMLYRLQALSGKIHPA
ncbi:MAG: hypothetical protein CMJ76_07160 [Planctomycetaceae bacterium]|nr:hypothetical protein [Planctomycetaceae bacterium]